MDDLSNFTDLQLIEELERRSKENIGIVPSQLDKSDWQRLQDICREYINSLVKNGYDEDVNKDMAYYVFKVAIETLYGENIQSFIDRIKQKKMFINVR